MDQERDSLYSCFNFFKTPIDEISLPDKFTNPFNAKPHPLCKRAAKELQQHLNTNKTKGKMYGVLVVETKNKELGYLAAVSGNINNDETYTHFVPPVYDLTDENDFFKTGEAELTLINKQIEKLIKSEEYINSKQKVEKVIHAGRQEIEGLKFEIKKSKAERDKKRQQTTTKNLEQLNQKLIKESQTQKSHLAQRKKFWKEELAWAEKKHAQLTLKIEHLKTDRKEKSAKLQYQLFVQYSFFNANKNFKNLIEIFQDTDRKIPPAAAGECAAPKLLQHAFIYNLKPIAMAEFWWGAAPKSEIRKHGYYYPACQSKCKPILGFMLKGLNVEPDSFENTKTKLDIEIIYEDADILVINKPHNLLSVPGKSNCKSVYSQIKEKYPNATGPLIVHRLDMATSGLMIIALKKNIHENLQKQFLNHSINKCYVALLNGIIEAKEGFVELPLRVDLDDRPRQLVCYEHGKPAKTKWKVLSLENRKTRVHFFPITGRTHQLRVHAAHQNGLNMAIVGDQLYGKKADRLYLHAESIKFLHPATKKTISFTRKADF